MKVVLEADSQLSVSDFESGDFEVLSGQPDLHFSAIEMFITSLAVCTFSVLNSYGQQIGTSTRNLNLRYRWSYRTGPFRIANIAAEIHWPGLPEDRSEAAHRAADLCTLHNTLVHPPELVTRLEGHPHPQSEVA